MIRVLLADDELLARKRLTRLLEAMPDVEIVAMCVSGEEVLRQLGAVDVDVVLLDIQMPGLTGLETGSLISVGGPAIVFVTAHPEHAISAFDVGAVDYVVKPVEPARLKTAIERAAARKSMSREFESLPVQTARGIIMVDSREISHLSYDGYLVNIQVGERCIATTSSLTELADRLSGDHFQRVHRRHILNMNHVARLEPQSSGGYVAITRQGASIPIARQAARHLRKQFNL